MLGQLDKPEDRFKDEEGHLCNNRKLDLVDPERKNISPDGRSKSPRQPLALDLLATLSSLGLSQTAIEAF